MFDDEELARLQDVLLPLLHHAADGVDARARLEELETTEALRAWLDRVEDRPLDVATRLVKKWARRSK